MQSPEFETVKQAARRIECDEGHLRRLCEKKLQALGLAKRMKDAFGHTRWHVARSFDLTGKNQGAQTIDFDGILFMPTAQRKTIIDRAGVVRQWRESLLEARAFDVSHTKATATFLRQLKSREHRSISRSTLFNWDRQMRNEGLGGLIDGRCKPSPMMAAIEAAAPIAVTEAMAAADQGKVILTINIHASGRIVIDPIRSGSKAP